MLPNPKMFDESNAVMELSTKGFDFYISASAITDIYYITKKSCNETIINEFLHITYIIDGG